MGHTSWRPRKEHCVGFFGKAKENIEKVAKQGQDKLDEVQAHEAEHGLLGGDTASGNGAEQAEAPSAPPPPPPVVAPIPPPAPGPVSEGESMLDEA